jgi:signal peptidase II
LYKILYRLLDSEEIIKRGMINVDIIYLGKRFNKKNRMVNPKYFSLQRMFNKRWLRVTLFCFCSLSLISWDRISKDLAKEHLKDKAAYSYFHDTFRLQYIENTGAAMSFADDLPKAASVWLLGILPLAFLFWFLIYIVRRSNKMALGKLIAFSLIFAGGIGNIIDRLLFDRHVTDFMNLGILNLRTGVFNFADVWITAGFIYMVFFGRRIGKTTTQVIPK